MADYDPDSLSVPKGVSGEQRERYLALTDEQKRIYRYSFYVRGRLAAHCYQDSLGGVQVCECVYSCADDPTTRCSLSGEWHVHPGEPCTVHPDAPGDRQPADAEVSR